MVDSKEKKKQTDKGKIPAFTKHAAYEELYAAGKALRETCPLDAHAEWKVPKNRLDIIEATVKLEKDRIPELIPLRHGRMSKSPFTFYRAGAQTMAADLATTPKSGIIAQICGDAHLSNFGGFATPERQIIFSINDLDETLPAPWEWDVKRLTASFVIACRNNELNEEIARKAVRKCVKSYKEHMNNFSKMKQLELWYYLIETSALIKDIKDPRIRKRAIKRIRTARHTRTAESVFPKLVFDKDRESFIKDKLPAIFHMEGLKPGEIEDMVRVVFEDYRASLNPALQSLLDRYEVKDAAIKVVGVGSVGTWCWIILLMAANNDPLFLQIKQASASVLEPYAGKSIYANHGQRVVNGYRIMQPASDIFLGWTRTKSSKDGYFRQLRDMKVKMDVETFKETEMMIYADWTGHALALAHARSGNSAMISGYMGKSDAFDKAIENFSVRYADQNEKDYQVFMNSLKTGKLKAVYETDNKK